LEITAFFIGFIKINESHTCQNLKNAFVSGLENFEKKDKV